MRRLPCTVNRRSKGGVKVKEPVITPNHPLSPLITLVYDWSRDFNPVKKETEVSTPLVLGKLSCN